MTVDQLRKEVRKLLTDKLMFLTLKVMAEGNDGDLGWEPVNTAPLSTDFELFYTVRSIATPAAIVALAFCGIRWIMASDPKTADVAKTWLLAILGGVALFWLVPALVDSVVNAF